MYVKFLGDPDEIRALLSTDHPHPTPLLSDLCSNRDKHTARTLADSEVCGQTRRYRSC